MFNDSCKILPVKKIDVGIGMITATVSLKFRKNLTVFITLNIQIDRLEETV